MSYQIDFPGTKFSPVTLKANVNLSQEVDVVNSPLLFGCRTGICGTCVVQIDKGYDQLVPPDDAELETLEIYAPDNARARLACQINICSDISVTKIGND